MDAVTLPIDFDNLLDPGDLYAGRRIKSIERDWQTLMQTLELD